VELRQSKASGISWIFVKEKKMPNQNHQNLSNTSKSVSQTQKNSEWISKEENHEEIQAPITEYLKFLSFTTNPRPSPRGSRLTSMPLSTGSSSTAFWQIFQSRLSRDGKGHKFSSSKWQTLSLTRLKTKSRCRKRKIGRRGPKVFRKTTQPQTWDRNEAPHEPGKRQWEYEVTKETRRLQGKGELENGHRVVGHIRARRPFCCYTFDKYSPPVGWSIIYFQEDIYLFIINFSLIWIWYQKGWNYKKSIHKLWKNHLTFFTFEIFFFFPPFDFFLFFSFFFWSFSNS
jgi:hypothetical protein